MQQRRETDYMYVHWKRVLKIMVLSLKTRGENEVYKKCNTHTHTHWLWEEDNNWTNGGTSISNGQNFQSLVGASECWDDQRKWSREILFFQTSSGRKLRDRNVCGLNEDNNLRADFITSLYLSDASKCCWSTFLLSILPGSIIMIEWNRKPGERIRMERIASWVHSP